MLFFPASSMFLKVPASPNGNVTWRHEEIVALPRLSFGADNPHLSGGSRLVGIPKSHEKSKATHCY